MALCILRTSLIVLSLTAWALPATAQEAPVHGAGPAPAVHGGHAEGHDDHHSPGFEAEFAGSGVFQSGGLSVKLGSPLRAEVRYFGIDGNDIGVAGLGWELRFGGLRLIPGVAWAFGRENKPAPAVTARWVFENEQWISQGVWVQSLGEYTPPSSSRHGHGEEAEEVEEVVKRASVLDGIHISRRFGRLEVGPMIEHIRYREEDAWKGGGRVAVRIGHSLRAIGQIVGPATEVRGGLVWEY